MILKRIIFTTLTIMWMIVIFLFSNQKSIQSNDYSNSLIKNTIVNIYKIFEPNPTVEQIEEIIDIWDYPVRKTAHLTEYFILGILLYLTFSLYNIKNYYIMVLFGFLYAYFDEIHQLFVVGRDGNFKDVLIDTIGISLAIYIMYLLNKRKIRKEKLK